MDNLEKILTLPLETIVILACGYLGYRLAYAGRDQAHKPIDVVFQSLSFGLIAALILHLGTAWPFYIEIVAAFLLVGVSSLLWRKYLSIWLARCLRHLKLSIVSGPPNVWNDITTNAGHVVSQIVVYLKNGRALTCNDASLFEDEPHGPCCYGEDGSIAFYQTHFRNKLDDEWEESSDVLDAEYGSKLTFIPACEIERVDIRYA